MWVILMLFLLTFARHTYAHDVVQDGSGEIDLEELRTVMTSLGYSPTDKQLEDMMAKVSCACLQDCSAAQDYARSVRVSRQRRRAK